MKRFRLSLLCGLICTTSFFSHTSFAAAFQLYELGTPIIGTAGVGQAAVAEDASTAYFNPAGMGLLKTSQFMLSGQMLVSYVNFSQDKAATTIRGDNGGNAGLLTPGMDLYYVYSHSPKLKLGVSVAAPYGGSLNYTDGWVGRFVVQDVTFYAVDLNPSIAYRINRCLSIGAGATLEYINLQQTVALPITRFIDGQAKISVANFAPGFNLGAMFTPYESTKIGIAFRSQIVHKLHGNTTFLRINANPNTSTKMVMPPNVILSLSQDVTNHLTLLGELGWAKWSSMRDSILTVANFSSFTPLDWHNTYRVGLAGQYKFNPCFLFQMGASYDSSPTSSSRRICTRFAHGQTS